MKTVVNSLLFVFVVGMVACFVTLVVHFDDRMNSFKQKEDSLIQQINTLDSLILVKDREFDMAKSHNDQIINDYENRRKKDIDSTRKATASSIKRVRELTDDQQLEFLSGWLP